MYPTLTDYTNPQRKLVVFNISCSFVSRITVMSHKANKKQHPCASSALGNHYCELFTHMATLKYANPVPKLACSYP